MRKGFTLVELLVVVAIIGVLAAVLLIGINPLEQTRKARDTGKLSRCKEAISAAERYYAFHNDDPTAPMCDSLLPGAADELKAGACTDITLAGSGGSYTCTFTPESTAYITKCGGAVGETCIVPTEF